jgi:hypothetical protein
VLVGVEQDKQASAQVVTELLKSAARWLKVAAATLQSAAPPPQHSQPSTMRGSVGG